MRTIKSFKSLVSKFKDVVYYNNYEFRIEKANELIRVFPPAGCPICNDVLDDVALLRTIYSNVGYYCTSFRDNVSLVIFLMYK